MPHRLSPWRLLSSAILLVVVSLMVVSLSRWFLVASADATLAFAENGTVQTESETGGIF
jgi:hypothetical protein